MKILVIIPCYNEEASIASVIENLKKEAPFADYLVVNDCSTDSSRAILTANSYNHINNPVNLGIGGGMQAGYIYAYENDYDIAVQMDGDGQHDPKYLEKICDTVASGQYDMAIGSRFIEKEGFQSSAMRRFGIKILSGLIKMLTGQKIYDVTSGYRACNRKLIELFSRKYADDFPEPEAIMHCILNGYTVGEVPVSMVRRTAGVSSISSTKSAYYMIKVCLAIIVTRISTKKKKVKNKNAK